MIGRRGATVRRAEATLSGTMHAIAESGLRSRRQLGLACILVAGVLCSFLLAPGARAARAANPILFVNFFPNGTISVTLADGTPVGTTSGSPTLIPAGYYTLVYSGPGGCTNMPNFKLSGPG